MQSHTQWLWDHEQLMNGRFPFVYKQRSMALFTEMTNQKVVFQENSRESLYAHAH